jgi:hypothetical protein
LDDFASGLHRGERKASIFKGDTDAYSGFGGFDDGDGFGSAVGARPDL